MRIFIRYKILIISILFSAILLTPFLLDKNVFRQNDLDGDLLQLAVIKKSILNNHTFPLWNPYINQGVPVAADPLNSYLYPPAIISYLIFNPIISVKFIYLFSIALSLVTSFALFRSFKIKYNISLLLALTYASGGYLAARIVAGHFEKILSYPLLPLTLFLVFRALEKKDLHWAGLTSLGLSLVLFTGDIYNFLYLLIAILVLLVVNIKQKSNLFVLVGIIVLTLLFSSIKLIPILELQGYITKITEPFAGSQNPISIIYYMFLPIKVPFLLLHLQSFLNTGFAWWEKIAFIGPACLISVLFLKKKFPVNARIIIISSVALLLLLSMPGVEINPYNYLIRHFQILQLFHVPSRVFALLSVFILLATGLVLNKIKKIKIVYFILFVNLLLTCSFFYYILVKKTNPPVSSGYANAIKSIRSSNDSIYYVAQFISKSKLPQLELLKNNLKILESNYGLQLKNSAANEFTLYDFGLNHNDYTGLIPKYVLSDTKLRLPKSFNIENLRKVNGVFIYKISNSSFYSYSQTKIGVTDLTPYTKIRNGVIDISLPTQISGRIIVNESYYPGWRTEIGGKVKAVQPNTYLSSSVKNSKNVSFIFNSDSFKLGTLVSLISILSWIILIISQNLKIFQRTFLRHKPF